MRQGFTLIELMVTIAIVGILSATAMPFYNTYRQLAYKSEATATIKNLINGQITYYLENEKFFPPNDTIEVFQNDPQLPDAINRVKKNLNISIPSGHPIDYIITSNDAMSFVDVSLAIDNTQHWYGMVDKTGKVSLSWEPPG